MADVTSPAEQVEALAHRIAEAIGRKDADWVKLVLAPGFVHRNSGAPMDEGSFLELLSSIQADIVSVKLENVSVDVGELAALVTGIQVALVRVNGEEIQDRRGFVDWFVKVGREWRLRVAIDLGK